MITYFIRDNNNTYSEVCDAAGMKLKKNNKFYYGGVQWGDHKPTDVIEYITTTPEQKKFEDWCQTLGYEFVVAEE